MKGSPSSSEGSGHQHHPLFLHDRSEHIDTDVRETRGNCKSPSGQMVPQILLCVGVILAEMQAKRRQRLPTLGHRSALPLLAVAASSPAALRVQGPQERPYIAPLLSQPATPMPEPQQQGARITWRAL